MKESDASTSSSFPLSSYIFLSSVFILKTVPVSTENFCSNIGFPSLLSIGLPSESNFFTQFFKSIPIPPVTPRAVWKIGEMPLVPATIGAMLTNGMYGLACFPVHNATLFTPDILEDPTPIVPFSAINMTCLSGCCACSARISSCAFSEIMHLPCNSLSDRECAWLPGDNKSVDISPSAAT